MHEGALCFLLCRVTSTLSFFWVFFIILPHISLHELQVCAMQPKKCFQMPSRMRKRRLTPKQSVLRFLKLSLSLATLPMNLQDSGMSANSR
jgi:hypothetical protein